MVNEHPAYHNSFHVKVIVQCEPGGILSNTIRFSPSADESPDVAIKDIFIEVKTVYFIVNLSIF